MFRIITIDVRSTKVTIRNKRVIRFGHERGNHFTSVKDQEKGKDSQLY